MSFGDDTLDPNNKYYAAVDAEVAKQNRIIGKVGNNVDIPDSFSLLETNLSLGLNLLLPAPYAKITIPFDPLIKFKSPLTLTFPIGISIGFPSFIYLPLSII